VAAGPCSSPGTPLPPVRGSPRPRRSGLDPNRADRASPDTCAVGIEGGAHRSPTGRRPRAGRHPVEAKKSSTSRRWGGAGAEERARSRPIFAGAPEDCARASWYCPSRCRGTRWWRSERAWRSVATVRAQSTTAGGRRQLVQRLLHTALTCQTRGTPKKSVGRLAQVLGQLLAGTARSTPRPDQEGVEGKHLLGDVRQGRYESSTSPRRIPVARIRCRPRPHEVVVAEHDPLGVAVVPEVR
jgi:hypothetical protein